MAKTFKVGDHVTWNSEAWAPANKVRTRTGGLSRSVNQALAKSLASDNHPIARLPLFSS